MLDDAGLWLIVQIGWLQLLQWHIEVGSRLSGVENKTLPDEPSHRSVIERMKSSSLFVVVSVLRIGCLGHWDFCY